MKTLNKNTLQNIVIGANIMGTGGGGTLTDAAPLLKKIKTVQLVTFDELRDTDLVCTVFGIGGKQTIDPIIAVKNALSLFTQISGKKLSAIIAVEMGAESVATAAFSASLLSLPLLDSDIVGMRAAPEVYLELISLKNIYRTPCVISDDKKNASVVWNADSIQSLEKMLRSFTVAFGGDAYIAGYPMRVAQIKNLLPKNSISKAEQIGSIRSDITTNKKPLQNLYTFLQATPLAQGVITKTKITQDLGFESGIYTIQAQNTMWEVVFKNENIVLLKDNNVVVTVPDSIILIDRKTLQGINNFETNTKKEVVILAKKAFPLWRSKKGIRLFSPKNIGLPYKQKLL